MFTFRIRSSTRSLWSLSAYWPYLPPANSWTGRFAPFSFERCDWMVISTTSDIVSHANDTQKRDRERSNTCIRLQLFLRVSQNKQTKTKKRKRKEKCRQDFKQVRVELLRRSDLIGIGHTGQRPWPSTQRTSTLRELTNIRGCNEPVYMTYTERYTDI